MRVSVRTDPLIDTIERASSRYYRMFAGWAADAWLLTGTLIWEPHLRRAAGRETVRPWQR